MPACTQVKRFGVSGNVLLCLLAVTSRKSMDPNRLNFHGSFCNLTSEFAVQVVGAMSLEEEIPTFVVLGSSCLIIMIMVLSTYYTNVLCSD